MSPADRDRRRQGPEEELPAEVRRRLEAEAGPDPGRSGWRRVLAEMRRRGRLLVGVAAVILLCLVGTYIAIGLRGSEPPPTSSPEAPPAPSPEAPPPPALPAAAAVDKLIGDFGSRLEQEMLPALSQPPDIENAPLEDVQRCGGSSNPSTVRPRSNRRQISVL